MERTGIFHAHPDDAVLADERIGAQGRDDALDGGGCGLAAALDGFIAPARIVINVRVAEPIEETLIELNDVAQMCADPVGLEGARGRLISGVV